MNNDINDGMNNNCFTVNFGDLYETVNEMARRRVMDMTEVKAADLGLDPRAGHTIWADDDCIAVTLNAARGLDYYGGFEYVDKDLRTTIGEYVFYSCEDSRVAEHLAFWQAKQAGNEE